METKLHGDEWDNIKHRLKMPQALLVNANGRRGCLALLWNRDLEVEVLYFSSHHIEEAITEDGADPWRLVGFYGHHEAARRKLSWSLLRFISSSSVLPTFFIGDFNEVFFHYEHVSQSHPRPQWKMNNFRQMAEECGIIDVGFSGVPFTWCNNFTSPYSTRARLDRGLASKDWIDEFLDAQLKHLSSNTSDHLPLLLNKGTRRNGIKRGKARFKFESSWCLYKETIEVVRTAWNKDRVDDHERNQFGCIQNSGLGLLKWKHDALGNVQHKIDLKQSALDRLNQGTITNASKIEAISLSKEIDKLREANDEYWRQQSRVEWRVKGDRNTTYFHALSAQRGKMSTITLLQDAHGSLNLYNLHTKKLSAIQRNSLEMEFLSSEVKNSIFSIKGHKAPEPDGMSG
ncbi:hypothetical protein LIER_08618 [Lithospermum erythrorhizon]|uniref:Endonuclease/exonuclease/phosphatase domain-containing protein n=1 Tax=Lithospermum erythrorhizon TaxID=34254 RepID=A0AAV3PCU1_LITER